MKTTRLLLSSLLIGTCLASAPALAQAYDNTQTMERVDRLEHDIMLLQRQVARGGNDNSGVITAGGPSDIGGGGSNPQMDVRLDALEEELRALRGKVEENDFQMRKLSDNMDKFQRDVDLRFRDLHAPAGSPSMDGPAPTDIDKLPPAQPGTLPAPLPGAAPAVTPAPTNALSTPPAPAAKPDATKPPAPLPPTGPTTAGDGILHTPEETNFSTPREHYNYAFRLLNQTQYDQAAASFDAFAKKYPKDPLIGNAFYWEGETYYIRRDYTSAADFFRQGFESMPEGPKAADNLLKLAMSLDALGRSKESCIVLQQIQAKFKKGATSVVQKADQEIKRMGCQ